MVLELPLRAGQCALWVHPGLEQGGPCLSIGSPHTMGLSHLKEEEEEEEEMQLIIATAGPHHDADI